MSGKSHGPGWIVCHDEYPSGAALKLVSVLPPRLSKEAVATFVQRTYIDRFATIEERLGYKKHPRRDHYLCGTLFERGGNIVHVGSGPYFHAFYACRITLDGNLLRLDYRILVNADDPSNAVFEPRQLSIALDTP